MILAFFGLVSLFIIKDLIIFVFSNNLLKLLFYNQSLVILVVQGACDTRSTVFDYVEGLNLARFCIFDQVKQLF